MKFENVKTLATTVALGLLLSFTTASAQAKSEITEQEAYEIGLEAYAYLHPLITMDVTRRVMTNAPGGDGSGMGPVNSFQHKRTFPDADMRFVVRPNFDTLYSIAWLDITKEPMIVTVPDTSDRYYILPLMDMWSDVFAAVGKRTSGTGAGNFVIVNQGYQGELPEAVEVIQAPTPYIWVINRIQTNGPKDYELVNTLQDGFKITPLSQWGKEVAQKPFLADPDVDMNGSPYDQVVGMKTEQYFSYGAELMKMHAPHVTDFSIVTRMKRIGMVVGQSFDFDGAPAIVQKALKRASVDGLQLLKDNTPSTASANGWQMNTSTMGVYGNHYMKRASIALRGLGSIPPEDAMYPLNFADSEGQEMVGTNNYVLHFAKEALPPVDAFWSITMYDEEGFQVANELNRFAIGDRDGLNYNEDGSLDVYIQAKSPGKDKQSNWLPSPDKGVLGITMRLYAPKSTALNGRWVPPAIKKVK